MSGLLHRILVKAFDGNMNDAKQDLRGLSINCGNPNAFFYAICVERTLSIDRRLDLLEVFCEASGFVPSFISKILITSSQSLRAFKLYCVNDLDRTVSYNRNGFTFTSGVLQACLRHLSLDDVTDWLIESEANGQVFSYPAIIDFSEQPPTRLRDHLASKGVVVE